MSNDVSRPDFDDAAVRERVAREHEGLVRRLALRFRSSGESIDDLTQVARMGLVHAMNRYEEGKGASFATFASRTIVGELKRHLRDKAWSVRVPRGLKEQALEIADTAQILTQRLGRSPTFDEIASEIDVSRESVVEALGARSAYWAASLDAPVSEDADTPFVESLRTNDDRLARSADRVAVAELIADLPDRERTILYRRFFDGLSQREIAEELDISQMHVSRLLRKSLQSVRSRLAEADPAQA